MRIYHLGSTVSVPAKKKCVYEPQQGRFLWIFEGVRAVLPIFPAFFADIRTLEPQKASIWFSGHRVGLASRALQKGLGSNPSRVVFYGFSRGSAGFAHFSEKEEGGIPGARGLEAEFLQKIVDILPFPMQCAVLAFLVVHWHWFCLAVVHCRALFCVAPFPVLLFAFVRRV